MTFGQFPTSRLFIFFIIRIFIWAYYGFPLFLLDRLDKPTSHF